MGKRIKRPANAKSVVPRATKTVDTETLMGTPKDPNFPNLDELPVLGGGKDSIIPDAFRPIRFLPGQQNPPPRILWGEKFEEFDAEGNPNPECMPLEWREQRKGRVAEAMNHAAAVAQDRLRETIDIANHWHSLLEQWQERDVEQTQVQQSMIDRVNQEMREKDEEITQLRAYVRAARADAVEHAMQLARQGDIDLDTQLSWGGPTLGERLEKESEDAA